MDTPGMDLLLEAMDQFANGFILDDPCMIKNGTIFQRAD
jgi:hypothetical protein